MNRTLNYHYNFKKKEHITGTPSEIEIQYLDLMFFLESVHRFDHADEQPHLLNRCQVKPQLPLGYFLSSGRNPRCVSDVWALHSCSPQRSLLLLLPSPKRLIANRCWIMCCCLSCLPSQKTCCSEIPLSRWDFWHLFTHTVEYKILKIPFLMKNIWLIL